jgi:hypothetical protein
MTDKYETEMFDDGTELTVRRLPKGADQQGRYPEAAEAATDVGQEDEDPKEDTMWFWVVIVVIFTAVVAAAAWERMA